MPGLARMAKNLVTGTFGYYFSVGRIKKGLMCLTLRERRLPASFVKIFQRVYHKKTKDILFDVLKGKVPLWRQFLAQQFGLRQSPSSLNQGILIQNRYYARALYRIVP